jgi:hypothetical protein
MDFYRNIDKISDLITGVSYGQVYDVHRAAVTVEPVTLSQLKDWAKITLDTDDGILAALIIAAREMCEKYTNVNFVARTVTAYLNNTNSVYLPYGPVGAITGVYNADDEEVEYEVRGSDFKSLISPKMDVKVVYTGGYTSLPENLRTAIKAQALFLYENRGDSDFKLSPVAKGILLPYRRI